MTHVPLTSRASFSDVRNLALGVTTRGDDIPGIVASNDSVQAMAGTDTCNQSLPRY